MLVRRDERKLGNGVNTLYMTEMLHCYRSVIKLF